MLLEFGKYKGVMVNRVPIEYMIFLAGYRLVGTNREECELEASQWVRDHHRDVHEFARNYLATRCWHCGRKLVPIGSSRNNGAAHHDWNGRYLHKKCWRKLNEELEWRKWNEEQEDESEEEEHET